MPRKRSPLPFEVLSFLLATLLGIAIGNLTNGTGALPWGLEFLRRQSLPLAGITVVLMIGLMAWQRRVEMRSVSPGRPVWDSERSPFPGLEAFTEEDSAVFFGRDVEITELLGRLNPVLVTEANRLVAVVGPSGVGKSSLVQAGVVPRLRLRRGDWIVAPPVVPGDHPLRSLSRSLAAAGSAHTAAGLPGVHFADELRTAQGRPSAPVLVIVDQAEELITLAGPAERDAFLDLLAGALEADSRLWIIMIMRSEFLTAFLGTGQARLFRDPVAVGTLSHAALVDVIEQPAQRAGLTFDPPTLPQRMAADAGGDALPLLAYALQELCLTAGPAGVLTADAYQRIGGVTGVLTRQADKVAAELGGVDGPLLPTLLKFVTIGENEPTRRRVQRNTLTGEQWRIAEAFIAARLLTSHTDGGDAILEVAHEALFRHWAPLQQAIEASADQLRWRTDLERWARDWENSGRQDAYLLRDERLKAAQHWASSDGEVINGLALIAEFLACSNRADRATMERLSETIAQQALATVDRDPDRSLLLALAAYEECAPTAIAIRALTAALAASHLRLRAVLRGHDDWVVRVTWSPDGRRLATASGDRTARIWDREAGTELIMLRGHGDQVRGLAWSSDGRRLATASGDRTVRLWDALTGNELAVLHGHDSWIWSVAWSRDGRHLATASHDRTIRIWDADTGDELVVLTAHDDEVREVAWSPDGQLLATASGDRTTRIWDADTGSELQVLRGHNGWVQGVAWSPDGRQLATASHDRTVRIWDAKTGKELTVLHGHEDAVRAVTWCGRCLATASSDRTARIWDTEAGSELAVLRGHTRSVRCVAWSRDGQLLATASDDCTVRVWDASVEGSGLCGTVLCGHTGWVAGVAWSPNGRRLATVSADRTVRVWDGDSGSALAAFRGHEGGVADVAWSPDGLRLATASDDQTVRIWDIDSTSEVTVLQGHKNRVEGVAWSPDSRRLATGSGDRTARIWDADNGTELAVLSGHHDWVHCVAWAPDGRRLATASDDRTARIWDTETARELVKLCGHNGWVRRVAWSPDGRRLATASRDGTCRIWDATISIEDLLANARRCVSRELSPEERRNLMLPPIGG